MESFICKRPKNGPILAISSEANKEAMKRNQDPEQLLLMDL